MTSVSDSIYSTDSIDRKLSNEIELNILHPFDLLADASVARSPRRNPISTSLVSGTMSSGDSPREWITTTIHSIASALQPTQVLIRRAGSQRGASFSVL